MNSLAADAKKHLKAEDADKRQITRIRRVKDFSLLYPR